MITFAGWAGAGVGDGAGEGVGVGLGVGVGEGVGVGAGAGAGVGTGDGAGLGAHPNATKLRSKITTTVRDRILPFILTSYDTRNYTPMIVLKAITPFIPAFREYSRRTAKRRRLIRGMSLARLHFKDDTREGRPQRPSPDFLLTEPALGVKLRC